MSVYKLQNLLEEIEKLPLNKLTVKNMIDISDVIATSRELMWTDQIESCCDRLEKILTQAKQQ